MLRADVLTDVLMLLDEEHAMYRELLAIAREQGRVLAGEEGGRSLVALQALRESVYSRLDASERTCESLLAELDSPPEPVRLAARAIRATIREVLRQDRDNERLLEDIGRAFEPDITTDSSPTATH